MASIIFYYMPFSPPCRMVQMVASIAGVSLEKRLINLLAGDQLKDEYVELNPLHKVPFIVDGDLKMNESRAIILYLVNKYMPGDDTFYPKDALKRARVDELLFIELSLWNSLYKLYRPRMFEGAKTLDSGDEKAARNYLVYLNGRLEECGKKFMLGDDLTIADVALAATLTFSEVNDMDLSELKSLTSYYERLKNSIPDFDEINKIPIEEAKKFIKSKMEE